MKDGATTASALQQGSRTSHRTMSQPIPAPSPSRTRRLAEVAAITPLLFLASFLRLGHLGLVSYRYDDDILWNIVTRIARSGQVPYKAMWSSMGLDNGPFQALLLLPAAWIGESPVLMIATVAALNVVSLAIAYRFARDFFGTRVALITLILAAANPWSVIQAQRLMGQDLIAPFASLTLWMLARWLFLGRGRALLVAAVSLAVGSQVYVVGLECLAMAAATVALAGRRLWSWWVAAAFVLFAVIIAPYAWLEVIPKLHIVVDIRDSPDAVPVVDLDSARLAITLASNEGYQYYAPQATYLLDAAHGVPGAFGLSLRLLYVAGIVIGAGRLLFGAGNLRDAYRGIHVLLLAAVLAPIVLLVRHAVPVYPYYFGVSFPAPYLYGALALEGAWLACGKFTAQVRTPAQGALAFGVGASLVVQCALAGIFLSVAGEYRPNGNYGMSWRMVDHLVGETAQLARERGVTRILVPESNRETNLLWRVMVDRGMDAVAYDETRMLLLSSQPALSITLGHSLAEDELQKTYGAYVIQEEQLQGEGASLRYYMLPPEAATAPLPPGAVALDWPAGGLVRLDGVAMPDRVPKGAPVVVTTYTTILQTPQPDTPNFSIFAHLTRSDGQSVGQRDEAMLPTVRWAAGDRIVHWLEVAIPPDAAPGVLSAKLGMYALGTAEQPGLHPLDLHDAKGANLGASAVGASCVIGPAPPAPPSHPIAVRFANGINLSGYDLTQEGATLHVIAHWSAVANVPINYTAFVHVLNGAGKLVAQSDSQPMRGQFPTTFWEPGDAIADPHDVALPSGLPAGSYRLEFGLYDLRTLQRLLVLDGQPLVETTLAGA